MKDQLHIISEQKKKEKIYWFNQFKEFSNTHVLSEVLVARAVTEDATSQKVSFVIADEDFVQLMKICKNVDHSLHLFLHTTLLVLLYKYTGESNTTIGTTIYKQADNHEKLINYLLPINQHVNPKDAAKTILMNTKAVLSSAIEHQNFPFEILKKHINAEATAQDPVIFDVVLLLENIHSKAYLNEIDPLLLFSFHNQKDQLKGELIYKEGRLSKEIITSIITHFKYVLKQIVHQIDINVTTISLLTPEEKHILANEWNVSLLPIPTDKTIHELFEAQVVKTPNNKAIVFEDTALTYKELNAQANYLAHRLVNKGIATGEVVGVMTSTSLEMIIGLLAVLKAGGSFLPIDPTNPVDRIDDLLKDSNVQYVLVNDLEKQHVSLKVHCIKIKKDTIQNSETEFKSIDRDSKDLCYVIYTSGSTGTPNGVKISHKALINLCSWHNDHFNITQEDRSTKIAGFGFDASVWEIFPYLIKGATLFLAPDSIKYNIHKLHDFIQSNEVTICFLPTKLGEAYIQRYDVPILRHLLLGGEKLSRIQKRSYTISNAYGPTENAVVATIFEVKEESYTNVPIGKPISNTKAHIINPKTQELLPLGMCGELCISGFSLADGYMSNETLTNSRFVKGLIQENEISYRTGDLVRWNTDGNIEFIGRIDSQISIRGFRIEPSEVEKEILKIVAATHCIVIKKTINEVDNALCAFIETDENFSVEKIKNALEKRLPSYMIPSYIIQLEKLPLTNNGKINVKKLKLPKRETQEITVPINEIEHTLVNIWSKILKNDTEKISTIDSFFELGGNSLSVTLLNANILSIFQVDFPIKELFQKVTVKNQSAYIATAKKALIRLIPKAPIKKNYSLSSAQKRILFHQKLNPLSPIYNIPNVFELKKYDPEKLEKAFRELIIRHEILRTSFHIEAYEPVQVIHSEVHFSIDIITTNSSTVEEKLEALVKPFQLEKGNLFRVTILKTENGQAFLFIDIHHMICDGVSIMILLNELVVLHSDHILPTPKLQYKDFSEWENDIPQQLKKKKQEQFWLTALKEPLPILDLITDYKRPEEATFEGNTLHFAFDVIEFKNVKTATNKNETTLFVFLLAAFKILLSKVTTQKDIIVGTAVTGRVHAELQHTIGNFVNTVCIRSLVNENEDVASYIKRLKSKMINVFENQTFPFEKIVEKLDINRQISRNPVFDTSFVLQNIAEKQISIIDENGLSLKKIEQLSFTENTAKVDIVFTAILDGDQLAFTIGYKTKIFKESSITQLFNHYKYIVNTIVSNDLILIKEINLPIKVKEIQAKGIDRFKEDFNF